jgi:hypothetical protein
MIILAVAGYDFSELRKTSRWNWVLELEQSKNSRKGIIVADIAVLDGFIVVSSDAYQAGY